MYCDKEEVDGRGQHGEKNIWILVKRKHYILK
jgi:hypothetical protein